MKKIKLINISKYINLIIYIIYHRVKHKKSVFMRVCKLLHFPTGVNGHLPTGENEKRLHLPTGENEASNQEGFNPAVFHPSPASISLAVSSPSRVEMNGRVASTLD